MCSSPCPGCPPGSPENILFGSSVSSTLSLLRCCVALEQASMLELLHHVLQETPAPHCQAQAIQLIFTLVNTRHSAQLSSQRLHREKCGVIESGKKRGQSMERERVGGETPKILRPKKWHPAVFYGGGHGHGESRLAVPRMLGLLRLQRAAGRGGSCAHPLRKAGGCEERG